MKWYTAIVHVEGHVTPTQYFHTRADSYAMVEAHVRAWFDDPQFTLDLEYVFEGKLEPISESE